MMEFVGWAFCLLMAIGSSFTSWLIVAMSGWGGKVEKVPLIIALLFSLLLWYITINLAPFTINLK